jgi:hypothetical protein
MSTESISTKRFLVVKKLARGEGSKLGARKLQNSLGLFCFRLE